MKLIFTLCSNNYLAQAKTLGDSILNYLPEYKFIIGLVDQLNSDIDYRFFEPHQVLCFDELKMDALGDMLKEYNIVEFNTAVKPFYFQYLFSSLNKNDLVFYIDPDITIFSDFVELEDLLKVNNFLLTPHLLTALTKKGPHEQLVLNVGVFNFGFLGIRKCLEADRYLSWWANRLETSCHIDFANGLFVDQLWGNFLPLMFDGVHILKSPGYNMGYWNFEERNLSFQDGKYYVNEDYKLSFFHFSNFNPLKPKILCRWLNYSFEKRPDLMQIYDDYGKSLIENRYEKFHRIPRGLQFKENHPHFDNVPGPITFNLESTELNSLKSSDAWPRISIITPCYNHVEFIETTIISVIEQRYPNLEYIIIDGGSTDGSVEIIKKYEKYLTYWVSEKDAGQTNAINKGFKKATGDIITWLNSDDYYYPHVFHDVANYFITSKCDFLAGSVNLVDKDGEFLERKEAAWPTLEEGFFSNTIYIAQPASFFKRSLLELVGYLDESYNYAMDFDFWVRLRIKKVEFTVVKDVFTNFRTYEGTKSSEGEERFMFEIFIKYWGLYAIQHREVRRMISGLGRLLLGNSNITNKRAILYRMIFADPKYVFRTLKKRIAQRTKNIGSHTIL